MEKPKELKEEKKQSGDDNEKAYKSLIWDCGSTLYDSFELKSFERTLDSAMASRTLSMPHLSHNDHHHGRVLIKQPPQPHPKKPLLPSKISRSFHKLLRSVFKPNKQSNNKFEDGFYVAYDMSGALSTIPEGPEFDGLSPDIKSLVTRTGSDRFMAAASLGISCA